MIGKVAEGGGKPRDNDSIGGDGGSGAGGTLETSSNTNQVDNGGSGTALQGNDGGGCKNGGANVGRSGGGGGAGAAGATGAVSGNGGVGLDYSTEFGTDVGESGWFSGGAGGCGYNGSTAGFAGDGGNGGGADAGESSGDADSGLANTGGGGASAVGTSGDGGDGGSGVVIIKYLGTVGNMTLVSESTEAEANPSNIRMFIVQEDTDACTVNTDITGEVSRDSGANWVAVTLVDEGDIESSMRILSGTGDVSGQAADKTIKWRVKTLNNKDQDINAIGLIWD